MSMADLIERAHDYLAMQAAESGADVLIAELADEIDNLRRLLERTERQLAEAQAELALWRASFPGSAEAVQRDALSPPHAAAMGMTDE
jgi:hypothetical protein